MPATPSVTADDATDQSSIIFESASRAAFVAATGTPREFNGGHRGGGVHGGDFGGMWNLGNDSEDACVTLAITTCKRLRLFLGTAEGLQVPFGIDKYINMTISSLHASCTVLALL